MGSRAAVRDAFGNLTLQLSSHLEAQSSAGVAPLAVRMSVHEWIEQLSGAADYPYVFMVIRGSTQWPERIRRSYDIPELLKEAAWQFFVSGGTETRGLAMHAHPVSWLAAIAGAKDWYVFPPDELPFEPGLHRDDQEMMSAPHVQHCRQMAGEIVLLPEGWWHATANVGEWSWGFGAQGLSEGLLFDAVVGDVDALARSPEKLSASSEGKEPIHAAAAGGHVAAVELLIEAGARVDGSKGQQPLHMSAEFGHSSVTKLLLERSADLLPDAEGRLNSPLASAARTGHTDTLEVLLEAGATVSDESTNAALHIAVFYGHMAATETLLASGIPVDTPNEGNQAIHIACEVGYLDLLNLLLRHGASIEARDSGERLSPGARPLHYAAAYGHLVLVKALLEAGASRDAATEFGDRAIDLAKDGPRPSEQVESLLASERDAGEL